LITVAPNLGTGVEDLRKLIKSLEALRIVPGAIAIDTTSRSLGGADENGPVEESSCSVHEAVVERVASANRHSHQAGQNTSYITQCTKLKKESPQIGR
jgi:hypothetical protein